MITTGWSKLSESEHFVQFCETDAYLINSVSKFIGTGLMAGDAVIVLATNSHRAGFEERLKEEGLVVDVARAHGQYISLDAAATLPQIMVDGLPEPGRFARVIGGLLAQAARGGRQVRIFGELVALLWLDGNRAGAIHLEKLWNDLASTSAFSLFCAYPMQGFDREMYGEEFTAICRQHERVIPTESYTALTDPDERLLAITLLQQKANALEVEVAERKRVEEALRGSEARKDEFINMASHELRTPLTTLKGFTQVLESRFKKQGDEESLKFLTIMDRQLDKLNKLIDDLLDITDGKPLMSADERNQDSHP